MNKVFSLLFIILFAFKNFAFAQQKSEPRGLRPEVAACFLLLNFIGNYKRAIEVGREAVQMYPNDPNAHRCLGESYHAIGEFKLALEHMKRAKDLTSNMEDLMYIFNRIGMIYSDMGYLDRALIYYTGSLSLARNLGNRVVEAAVLNNIAGIYYRAGELDKALGYYEESLKLQTDEKEKATIYNNIAIIYSSKGNYQKAVEYFQKAIEIHKVFRDDRKVSLGKLNLGDTYRKMKDYEKAEKYILEGLEGVKKVGNKYLEAVGYGYLGLLYRDKGDKKTAKDYLIRAYNLFKSIGAEGDAKDVLSEIQKLEEKK
jgi:tetratricopeptide (TPR) repeat protein